MSATKMNKSLAATTKATGSLASKLPPPMKSAPMDAVMKTAALYGLDADVVRVLLRR